MTDWVTEYSNAPLGELELVCEGLAFPSSLAFDANGNAYVGETGLGFGGTPKGGRVLQIHPDGSQTEILRDLGDPLTGITFHENALWISQGSNPGRITRYDLTTGETRDVLNNLPGGGNYHTGEVAFHPTDGKLYWAQGAMTNTGIVGLDALAMGWLKKLPHSVDIPGYDVVFNDVRVTTKDPFSDDPAATVTTGPFAQFGHTVAQGTRVPGQTPATSAILRANPDGSEVELVCWGIRNAFGLRFLSDGRLLAMDQGADDRGSRPVANVPDYLWEVKPGAWYGWPDFLGGEPITSERFTPETGDAPTFILANHDELPPPETPLVEFGSHTASTKFDVAPQSDGALLVAALFGDETPMTAAPGHPTVGRALVLVRTRDWAQHILTTEALRRPIDVRFAPDGSLWIVDFGRFEMRAGPDGGVGIDADPASGKLWRLPVLPEFPG